MTEKSMDALGGAADAELRHATILKCDIVESTRIWSALDPSDGLALSRGVRKLIEDVVQRYGARIARWEGDGALVPFGYPDAREDAPEIAVRAGLELARAVRGLRVADVRLEFRVGIASGPVAIDHLTQSLEGIAINVAERLKSFGEPGWVVIDDATKHLAARFFDYEDLGTREAKGFGQGLHAWCAARETPIASRFVAQRFDVARQSIVGRSTELDTLEACWAKARAGAGQIVELVGPAGIGKSSLAKAAIDSALEIGATAIQIDCMPSTGNTPLYPVGVLLRRLAGIETGTPSVERDQLARTLLLRLLAEDDVPRALDMLSPLLGIEAAPAPGQSPDDLREATIDTICRMLRALAAQGPMIASCEDLHWADDTTATLVQRIAQQIGGLPAVLIVTTRPERERDLAQNLSADHTRIVLEALPPDEAADLVRSAAHGADLGEEVVQAIVSRCEGVPLVLQQLTRSAVESESGGALGRALNPTGGAVPATLQLVVESRLERFRSQRAVIQAASVLGREFSVGLLQTMLSEHFVDLSPTLDLLGQHGLFAPRSSPASDRARFTHAMIRDAVYQTLLRDDRRRLHSRAADILTAAYQGTSDASPDVLAHHLCEAARFVEAVRIRLEASSDTASRGAYVETQGHCESALALVEHVQDAAERQHLEFRLLVQLGVALTGRHGYSAPIVEQTYRQAREVCGHSAEAAMLYPIMRGLTALNLVRGNLPTGHELSLQSMEIADKSGRPEFRIDAMSVHCYAAMYYRDVPECRSWIERTLDLYRREGGDTLHYPVPNDAGLAALAILPTIEWLLGNPDAADRAILQGLSHVEHLGRDFDKAYQHAWIAGLRFTQRRYQESVEHAQICVAISQKNGFGEWYVTGLLVERLAQACIAPAPEALQQAADTMTELARQGVGLNASWYLWGLARGHRLAGNTAVAQHLIEEALRRAEASGDFRMHPELLILKAELEPDDAAALPLLKRAMSIADEHGAVANALRAAAILVTRFAPRDDTAPLAQATSDALDGHAACPEGPWMHERLAVFRRALAAIAAAVPEGA
ncbi:MAG TPA: AAA family ATPase [Burkholderiales bacterium]|nr:AAA family ATPase [Burkholderiales bacterium]